MTRLALTASTALFLLAGCTIQSRPAPVYASGYSAAPAPLAADPAPPRQAVADEAGMRFLGGRDVGLRADHDTIMVTAAEGRFRRIRMHVSGSPLEMYDVRVTFGDGSQFSPPTHLFFGQGSWSRDIDLPGDARIVRRVDFWYQSRGPRDGRARVQLFGS